MLDSGSTLKVEKIASADNLDIRRGEESGKGWLLGFWATGWILGCRGEASWRRNRCAIRSYVVAVLGWRCWVGSWISKLDIRVQVGTGKLIWESLGNSHDIGWDHLVQLGKRRWQKTEPWSVPTLRSRGGTSKILRRTLQWATRKVRLRLAGSQVKEAFQKVFNGVICWRQTLVALK